MKNTLKEIGLELIPYPTDDYFAKNTNQGWGCGYVKIPSGHPILIKIEMQSEFNLFNLYSNGFSNEITYAKWDKEGDYYKIGFDTRHTFNDSSDDEAYVLKTTLKLKEIVENYTFDDAKEDIDLYIAELKERLIDELNELEI